MREPGIDRHLGRLCSFARCRAQRSRCWFAHLERILKLDRLRLRGPCGACDGFRLVATAQNLRNWPSWFPNGRRARRP